MLDVLIRGGQVIDGTGAPRRQADVGIRGGRIVAVGDADEAARRVIDADGHVVAPGFIDIHTHFDAQAFWDPTLSPSPLHGVTSVFAGNCGFSVAPLTEADAGYLMRMLARVEGMPLESLEQGVPWNWRSTAEYLDALDGTLAINAGFMVGHSTLRRVVMGEAATERTATDDELSAMEALLRQGLEAGGMGFSSSSSRTHSDAEGNLVPSCHAAEEELVRLAGICRDHVGTSLEYMPGSTTGGAFTEPVVDLMTRMSLAAQRPLNWNILMVRSNTPNVAERLLAGDAARARGAKIVALHMPKQMEARVTFHSGVVLDTLPGWKDVMTMPPAARLAALRDREWRTRLRAGALDGAVSVNHWPDYRVEQTFAPANAKYEGRFAAEIAAEEGKDPFDVVLDIACADDLHTIFLLPFPPDTEDVWRRRAELFRDPRTVVGASDAGAHLDSLGTFDYATSLLSIGVREHEVVTTEEAVRVLTQAPAALYGLRGRGVLAEGFAADVVVFDEASVGSEPVRTRRDLPGGASRLYAAATGMGHVLVNGEPIVEAGAFTDARPGTVLRSGRDTVTPSLAG